MNLTIIWFKKKNIKFRVKGAYWSMHLISLTAETTFKNYSSKLGLYFRGTALASHAHVQSPRFYLSTTKKQRDKGKLHWSFASGFYLVGWFVFRFKDRQGEATIANEISEVTRENGWALTKIQYTQPKLNPKSAVKKTKDQSYLQHKMIKRLGNYSTSNCGNGIREDLK